MFCGEINFLLPVIYMSNIYLYQKRNLKLQTSDTQHILADWVHLMFSEHFSINVYVGFISKSEENNNNNNEDYNPCNAAQPLMLIFTFNPKSALYPVTHSETFSVGLQTDGAQKEKSPRQELRLLHQELSDKSKNSSYSSTLTCFEIVKRFYRLPKVQYDR